ncbi:hypothetical protein KI387_033027, partial [Taxus chinensis]
DLGAAKQILGMRISQDRKEWKMTLSQEEYIKKVLERFNMQDAKPRSLVGSKVDPSVFERDHGDSFVLQWIKHHFVWLCRFRYGWRCRQQEEHNRLCLHCRWNN